MSSTFLNGYPPNHEPAELKQLREEHEAMIFQELAETTRNPRTLSHIWGEVTAESVRLAILHNPACPAGLTEVAVDSPAQAFWQADAKYRIERDCE